MPVDPSILRKYDPREPLPTPPRRGLAALLIAGIGSLIVLVFFLFADGDPGTARAFIIFTVILATVFGAIMMFQGYQEDGFWGMLYAYRHPLGSELSGEGPPSWTRLACGGVLLLAAVLSFVLAIHMPESVPWDFVSPRPARDAVHDALLK